MVITMKYSPHREGAPFGPVWASLGLFKRVRACLGLSERVWACLGLFGPVWACLGLFGPWRLTALIALN